MKLFLIKKQDQMSFPKYYFKNKNELFFQQKLKVSANKYEKICTFNNSFMFNLLWNFF